MSPPPLTTNKIKLVFLVYVESKAMHMTTLSTPPRQISFAHHDLCILAFVDIESLDIS